MPELPEVETIRRGLEPVITGRMLQRVELFRPNLRIPFPPQFGETLEGKRVESVERRAKYLLLILEDKTVLIIHLGMSGRMVVYPALRNQRQKHDHVLFILEDGKEIAFNDARRFGLMTLTTKELLLTHPLLSSLGPEPLEDGFGASYLHQKLHNKKIPIKTALMDNHIVVGVGNIYACESLFKAGISPLTPACEVSLEGCVMLVQTVREVLQAAIIAGGSTLKDYVQAKGESGYFQHQFQVYGREGAGCFRCATPILRIRQAGRSSFYCPVCQN